MTTVNVLLLQRLFLAVSSLWECSFPYPYGSLSYFLLVSAQILAFLAILYRIAILYPSYTALVFLHSNYHFLCAHAKLFQSCWTHCPTLPSVALQAPLSMGFSRQEYWRGLLWSPPGDLPNPGIKPTSLTSPALAGGFFTTSATLTHCSLVSVQFSQFSRSVVSDSLLPHASQHARPPCPSPTPRVHSDSRPSSQ